MQAGLLKAGLAPPRTPSEVDKKHLAWNLLRSLGKRPRPEDKERRPDTGGSEDGEPPAKKRRDISIPSPLAAQSSASMPPLPLEAVPPSTPAQAEEQQIVARSSWMPSPLIGSEQDGSVERSPSPSSDMGTSAPVTPPPSAQPAHAAGAVDVDMNAEGREKRQAIANVNGGEDVVSGSKTNEATAAAMKVTPQKLPLFLPAGSSSPIEDWDDGGMVFGVDDIEMDGGRDFGGSSRDRGYVQPKHVEVKEEEEEMNASDLFLMRSGKGRVNVKGKEKENVKGQRKLMAYVLVPPAPEYLMRYRVRLALQSRREEDGEPEEEDERRSESRSRTESGMQDLVPNDSEFSG